MYNKNVNKNIWIYTWNMETIKNNRYFQLAAKNRLDSYMPKTCFDAKKGYSN